MPALTLPALDIVFGRQMPRLRGIDSWEDTALLGRANLERLVQLAQETARILMAEDSAHDELRGVRAGITYVNEQLAANPVEKPLLPRLRAENFRKGDAIMLYIADTPGTIAPSLWVPAVITDVTKSYRAEWADGSPFNTGYYWHLTGTASVPLFPGQNSVAFSTSEPRAIPAEEFAYLTNALEHDTPFVDVYSANAWRDWEPLWCQERGIHSAGANINMKAWLQQNI